MGLLAGRGAPRWHPAPQPYREKCQQAYEHCRRRGTDLEVLALQYVLQDERIPCTLVGMSGVAEVDTNLRALDEPFDPDLLAQVRAILEPVEDTEWSSGNWPVGQ
jgi:L-galactose dehydrogenase